MELQAYREQLAQVLQIIQHLFGVESAVFDSSASLVGGASRYREKKGTRAPKPPSREASRRARGRGAGPDQIPPGAGCASTGTCRAPREY